MLKKYSTIFILISILFLFAGATFITSSYFDESLQKKEDRRFAENWADSILNTLTLKEKIGQLISIRAHSDSGAKHINKVENLIKKYKVGGLTFFQGGPVRQAKLTNRYQKLSKVPLMIAIDGEWGLGMRLDSTIKFPYQMTLGAIEDDSLIYDMGKEVAYQMKRLGIHVNFAPVIDINNNVKNPVINFRSFGEDKEKVVKKGLMYMKGMQDGGILACIKHFPGHGDTNLDSHIAQPIIKHDTTRLNNIELYPFKKLINKDAKSVMIAHLKIPALDKKYITTASKKVVTDLLQNKLGFKGLIFTDALGMKGIASIYPVGQRSLKAFLAGNDILLLPESVAKAITSIEQAVKTKKIKIEEVNRRVKKVLIAKYKLNLHHWKPVKLKNLSRDLNNPKALALREKLFSKAITVVKKEGSVLPIRDLDESNSIASVAIGTTKKNPFQKFLDKFAKVEHHQIKKSAYAYNFNTLLNKVKGKKTVIISLHGMRQWAFADFGLTSFIKNFIKQVQAQNQRVILVVLGNPYSLKYFENSKNLICTYQDNYTTQKLVPEVIFGLSKAEGKLPVSPSKTLKSGTGITLKPLQKLFSALPEKVGMSTDTLRKIDTLINKAIIDTVMPGCQVLVARQGKTVWNKAYGYYTYDKKKKVSRESIYDIASVTKVAGTLQAIMWLVEKDSIDLDAKASKYLPSLKKSNKKNITIKEILTHQAGLVPYIPHYKKTLFRGKISSQYYRSTQSADFPHQVAQNLYAKKDMEDLLWKWTIKSDLAEIPDSLDKHPYVYSDLSFYILKRLAEKKLQEPIEQFLDREIYKPLKTKYLGFNPLQRFPKNELVPTEKDTYFRNQLIQGTVHDQGAAMLGGVGGHAGLFSNAEDLAKLLQMQLNGGFYDGKRYFKQSTVDLFIKQHYEDNRRALGWDRPPKDDTFSYIADEASENSFGHSGFTGCVVWVDKDKDLLIIFLSNRIHPSVDNRKLIKEHIRRKVKNIVYQAIIE